MGLTFGLRLAMALLFDFESEKKPGTERQPSSPFVARLGVRKIISAKRAARSSAVGPVAVLARVTFR